MTERQYAAGGIVVKKEGASFKVLLIKDGYGHWIWPKGHAEKDETAEETALREVSEETGLRALEIIREIGVQEYYFMLKGKRVFKTVRVYLMENTADEELHAQASEIEEARWFTPEEALDKIEYEGSKDLLQKGIRMYEELNGER